MATPEAKDLLRRRVTAEIAAAVAYRGDVDDWVPGEILELEWAGWMLMPSSYVVGGRRVHLRPREDVDVPDGEGWWWSDTDDPSAEPFFVAGPPDEPPVVSDAILTYMVVGVR